MVAKFTKKEFTIAIKYFFSTAISLTMLKEILKPLAVTAYTPFAAIFWALQVKFPAIHTNRIGHLMQEPDCFLKEQLLTSQSISRLIMLAPKDKSANRAAIRYWSNYFFVVENRISVLLLRPFQHHPWTRVNLKRYVSSNGTADCYRIYSEWGNRPPLLKLEQFDIERGDEILAEMGVPKGAWYVCIHAREGGYSVYDEHLHKHRNMSITQFQGAIEFIVSKGGWCIRMGDSTMEQAPIIPGLIDYALSDQKQDWMDLYLSAKCKFFLGSNSGAIHMANVFGVPAARVGLAPLSVMSVGVNDICIPMLYRSNKSRRLLTFNEIFKSKVSSINLNEDFEKYGISLEKNTQEDILDLTIEMFSRVFSSCEVDKSDELRQERFKSMLRPGHFSYGSASRVGRKFLEKYQHLLN